MTDKKDNNNSKKPIDDLLEGFDDAFDDEISKVFDQPEGGAQNTQIASGEKTEFFENDNKTQIEDKDQDEKTHVSIKNREKAEPSVEKTRGSYTPHVSTEDLSNLFDDKPEQEGKTDDISNTGLISPNLTMNEGFSVELEGKTEDFSSMIDTGWEEPSKSAPAPQKEVFKSDLTSLIEEEVNSNEQEARTEDASSMVTDIQQPIAQSPSEPGVNFEKKKMEASKPERSKEKEESAPGNASEPSIEYIKSEDSVTQRVSTRSGKMKVVAIIAGVVLVVLAGAGFVITKVKSPEGLFGFKFGGKNTQETTQAAAPASEKIVESAELLKELDEKYSQVIPFFEPDRFQSYTEALTRLEEILTAFPNHKKANSQLAEAMLLKFEGYLDNDRKNSVNQFLQKAEELDPNSVDTLTAKARALMVDGKLKDADVRIRQALSLNPKDAETMETLGEIQLASNQLKEALQSFSTAQDLSPKSVRPRYFYNLAKEKAGDLKGASQGFAKIIQDGNNHPKSSIEKFIIDMKQNPSAKVKTDFTQYLTSQEKEISPFEAAYAWKTIAQIELERKNTDQAIEALEKSVAKMPLDSKVTFTLANLYFQKKDFNKASQYYSTSVTLDPDDMGYLLQLGICLAEQGRLKEAEEQLKKVTVKEPTNTEGLYQWTSVRAKMGFTDEVIAQLKTNIKDNPKFHLGKVLLGNVLVEQSDFKESLPLFTQVLSESRDNRTLQLALMGMGNYFTKQELWSKAKPYLVQADAKKPHDYKINFELAKCNIQLNQINEAQNNIREMEQIDAQNIDIKLLQAGILVQKGSYDKAVEIYRDVLKVRESDYETRILLAKALMEKKEFLEAKTELMLAYRHNANYFYTYYYLALAQRQLGDFVESARNLDKAISILPGFYKAHYEQLLNHLHNNDIQKAESEMKTVLELQPSMVDAPAAVGDYYFDHSGFKDATAYYEQALAKQPNRTDIMLKLAKAHHEMGQDKKAEKLVQKILQLRPSSGSTYFELGLMAEEDNNLQGAMKLYQRSVALAPKDPRPYYQMGFIYKQFGQNSRAVSTLRTFLQLNPNAVEKPDVEQEIQKLTKR